MVNPAQVGYSVVPSSKWEIQHSCVSAYFVSAQAASSSPDVYDDSLFTLNVYWPIDWPLGPRWLAVGTAVPQAAIVVIAVLVLRPWALRRTDAGIWNGPPIPRKS